MFNFFLKIPFQRMMAYIAILGVVPLLLGINYFLSEQKKMNDFQNLLELADHQLFIKERKEAFNSAVQHQFRDADHFYIDKYLETLVFLESEIESLQQLMQDKNFSRDDRIKQRYEFLTSPKNSMVFSEGVVQSTPILQETLETLVNPVEVNLTDIKKILSRIEGLEMDGGAPSPGRPQLIITDFKIEKKKPSEKNEVFLLNLKLIKREFL